VCVYLYAASCKGTLVYIMNGYSDSYVNVLFPRQRK